MKYYAKGQMTKGGSCRLYTTEIIGGREVSEKKALAIIAKAKKAGGPAGEIARMMKDPEQGLPFTW